MVMKKSGKNCAEIYFFPTGILLERFFKKRESDHYGQYVKKYDVLASRERVISEEEIPKVFWKYFDLYRRKQITMDDYTEATGLSSAMIRKYLVLIG